MKRTALVTGACGLIGSHLTDALLKEGWRVTGVDNLSFGKIANIAGARRHPAFRFIRADVCRDGAWTRSAGKPDVVVHLAAVKKIGEGDAGLPTLNGNAAGTEAMLRFAEKAGAKFVLGSTSDVYGCSPKIPFSEESDCVIGPSTAKRWSYAVAKLFAEHLAFSYHKDRGVPVVVLRYFGCFSERSSTGWSGGHIPIFIESAAKKKPPVIHGDGRQTRSMAHVSDIVRGTILAMKKPSAVGEIINLGNDEEISVLESARRIHRLLRPGEPFRPRLVPTRRLFGSYREITRRVPDLRKAKRLLGYEPKVNFGEALRLVLAARGLLE